MVQKDVMSRTFNITDAASVQCNLFVTAHDQSRFKALNFKVQIDPQ